MPAEPRWTSLKAGETLLNAINSMAQIAKMHSDNNELLIQNADKFLRLIDLIGQTDDQVTIRHTHGRFYFQQTKLPTRPSNARLLTRILRFMENRGIYGLLFQCPLKGVAPAQIITFFRLIEQSIGHELPSRWLEAQCGAKHLPWVAIEHAPHAELETPASAPDGTRLDTELARKKHQIRATYAHTLSSVKEVAFKLNANQAVGLRRSIRLVQSMVDIISEDESLFLGISTIRFFDDYTYVHSLNVAVLAMCLGKRIGLGHDALERLGLCGLFHDLGKVAIPKEILNKRDKLSPEEFDLIKTHTMHSARLILKLKAQPERIRKLLVPPFEHHMGYDHSGYPQTVAGPGISLFGRILTIADVYDAITSPRIYRQDMMSPDKALAHMLERSGTHFDPILLKVFINMLGAYPVGTLLQMDTGELGIVIRPSGDHDHSRPVVQLIVPDEAPKYKNGAIVALSEKDGASGTYLRNIVKTMHPATMGLQAAAFLLN